MNIFRYKSMNLKCLGKYFSAICQTVSCKLKINSQNNTDTRRTQNPYQVFSCCW